MLLVLVALLAVPINSYALESQDIQHDSITLTLEDCMSRALVHTHQGTILNQQMEGLWEQQNELMEMSNAIQQQLDLLDQYSRLYEKQQKGTTLTFEEGLELEAYQYMFGPTPPLYSQQELFNQFIKNRDFPHYSVWATYQNLRTNRVVLDASIKMSVKQLFDGLIDMQDTLILQQELYENMQKQNAQMLVMYEAGLVSGINKYMSDCSLEKQRISIEKLKRTRDNMMMTLKQQVGVALRQEIELSYDDRKVINSLHSFPSYIKKAMVNRSEILNAKMDLQVKQREDDIMKKYITNELLSERMEADMALEENRIAYDEAINSVTADITSGYKDVKLKLDNYYISVSRLQNAERQYKEAKQKYDKGLISLSSLWNVELTRVQAKTGRLKAMRDYNNALYKLEVASGIGPGYEAGLGGY